MYHYPADIYTEPEPDADTLANLGPLAGMAGIWSSAAGQDVNPKPDGPEHQRFIERYELQPIDAQTNGPQLFYGLRYHTRIVKPDDPETYHDQVGYWLWEPATHAILLSLSIPRGQTAMAVGRAAPDAKSFTLEAVRGSLTNGTSRRLAISTRRNPVPTSPSVPSCLAGRRPTISPMPS